MSSHSEPEPSTPGLISEILRQLDEEVLAKLRLARSVAHPGESGRARENVVSDALRTFVPDTFAVSTGFVIDALGGRSRQIDIVIHRRGYHPLFVVGGIPHFMVESVVAVLENKTAITFRSELTDALEVIASVKALDRTNRGANYVVHGSNRGETVTTSEHFHQVFGAVVTEASMTADTLSDSVISFLASHDRRLWPNMYVDVNGLVGYYLDAERPTDKPSEASRWLIRKDLHVPPFVELLGAIANLLRVAPLIDYKPSDYLPSQRSPGRSWPLPSENGIEPESTTGISREPSE